ncbi:hypothetical protein SAMN05443574_1475 [Haloarcula vallismortis]|uniref:Uncharacterized protein n=1 Tax=Haloarcula vallismortis TaxID=28442 RepID=A0A1H3BDU9_HALVA|nr:hypothetical protein SAMN05443574_1475 [Haloarcula vallismortis]
MTQCYHDNIKQVLYSNQRVKPGRHWAHSESPGIRGCQRHGRVLDMAHSLAQSVCLSEWCSNPNPFRYNACLTISSYVPDSNRFGRLRVNVRRQSFFNRKPNVPVPSARHQDARLCHVEQQKNGGQPWNGGSGVDTIGSRHPRRRVLDPGQSMNLGGFKREWSGDQNPTERYVVGNKNSCDIVSQFIDLPPSRDPLTSRSCGGEVAR